MAEQSAFDRKNIDLQTLIPTTGLLEQLNLPPAVISFIRRNQRTLWVTVTVCVALIVGVSAFSSYRQYRSEKAASALDTALAAQQDKQQLLEKVVQEYGGTSSGLWAKIELALLEEKQGQGTKAITLFEEINAALIPKSLLKPLVLNKLAVLFENEKQFDKALALYRELATWKEFAPDAYRAMGRVNEELGKKTEAAAKYSQYLQLSTSQEGQGEADPVREMVQSRLNQLKK